MKIQIPDRHIRAKMVGHKGPSRFALRIGELQRVDYENMVGDIHWLQGSSPPAREVPLSNAYWSPRGFLGAMPVEGATVICGFSAAHEDHATKPYILAYLPNGYITALGFDPFGVAERGALDSEVPLDVLQKELDGIYGPKRHKMRKLYPGDIYGASDKGAEFILDTDARLFDASGAELWLRAEDQSFITTTMDAYHTTSASRFREGRVVRKALTLPVDFVVPPQDTPLFEVLAEAGIIFDDGSLAPDINSLGGIPMPSGETLVLVGPSGTDLNNPEAEVWTERRVEMYETTPIQKMPYPDHYGMDADKIGETKNIYIEKVSGTVVGNDAFSLAGRSTYGKPLKPVLFTTASSPQGSPRLESVEDDSESSLTGAYLYRMVRPDGLGEVFIAHDKEGHYFLSIPASTSKKSNLGAGRSVEADIKGSIKAVVGANKGDRSSLDLNASGGMKWNLGTLSASERSLDINAKGGISLKAGQDLDGSSFTSEMDGDVGLAITGSFGVGTSEDILMEATGQTRLISEGMFVSVGNGDLNETILSNRTSTVKGQVGQTVGQGIKTIVLTPIEGSQNAIDTQVLSGNRETLFGVPAQDNITFLSTGSSTVQATGSLSMTWQSAGNGDFTFQSATGTYSVNVGGGAISMNSTSANISASANISLQAPNISVVGRVALGTSSAALAVPGGVPGPSPYLDPLTGLPLTGNPLVNVP